jgi:hypothetical protein
MSKQQECPKCLGAKEIMVPRTTRGFDYEECELCSATGTVDDTLHEDYLLSLNEDAINQEENNY